MLIRSQLVSLNGGRLLGEKVQLGNLSTVCSSAKEWCLVTKWKGQRWENEQWWGMHSKVQKCKARYTLFLSVHCSSSLHLAFLEGSHITYGYWKKRFVGIMFSYYCFYYLQYSEQTMLLKKWWQALPHLCTPTAELKHHVYFLALTSALFPWHCSSRRASPLREAAVSAWSCCLNLLGWNLLPTSCQGVRNDVVVWVDMWLHFLFSYHLLS